MRRELRTSERRTPTRSVTAGTPSGGSLPRLLLAAGVPLVLALAPGCASGAGPASAAEPAPPSITFSPTTAADTPTSATPSASPSPSTSTEERASRHRTGCRSVDPSDGVDLAHDWQRVLASRGAHDHQKWVEKLNDDVSAVSHGAMDDDTCIALAVQTSQLALDAALLGVAIRSSDRPAQKYYSDVAQSGDDLLDALGVDSVSFAEH